MPEITDQTNFKLLYNSPAERIISLVPSITELLYHLQLENAVSGITRYCTQPPHWRKSKQIIGGTKKINHELIDTIHPDLIIANKEENTKEDVERLRNKFPVYTSDVKTIEDALLMIKDIGLLTGKEYYSNSLTESIRHGFRNLQLKISAMKPLRVIYLIWQNPFMTAGSDTFIHSIMQSAGFINVFENALRYPAITAEQLMSSGAEVIFLSSEPYPFKQKHLEKIQQITPGAKVMLVDGTYFSWYGSRLADTPEYLLNLRIQIEAIRNFGSAN
jgi:ABC-type Fe3+-hydroxamate transport system substrate-binding protein